MTVTTRRNALVNGNGRDTRRDRHRSKRVTGREVAHRRCDLCETFVVTTVQATESIVIDVRGPTCGTCNSAAEPPGAPSSPDAGPDKPVEEVQVFRGPGEDGAPRWRTSIGPDGGGSGGGRPTAGPQEPLPPVVVDGSWERQLSDRLSRLMGVEEWVTVGELWEPAYCDIVVELADVLDHLLTQAVPAAPTGLLIRISLRELPLVVSALLAAGSAAPPSLGSESGSQVLRITPALRALGPTVCIGSGHGATCGTAAREFGTLSAPLTVGTLASSSARHALAAVGGGSSVRYFTPLLRLRHVQAARVTPGLVGSVDVLGQSGHAPRTASRFGER